AMEGNNTLTPESIGGMEDGCCFLWDCAFTAPTAQCGRDIWMNSAVLPVSRNVQPLRGCINGSRPEMSSRVPPCSKVFQGVPAFWKMQNEPKTAQLHI
ncbi:MAG TPA: hypothetical protein VHD56_05145, partial [Tepidisphaeraceae bacterium]|nr:hypothetical protein [Tepidisphaeraceae bacterium]